MTDEVARENFLKYGNPDGKGAFATGIALPKFLQHRKNSSVAGNFSRGRTNFAINKRVHERTTSYFCANYLVTTRPMSFALPLLSRSYGVAI